MKFVSVDGLSFDTEKACREHEESLKSRESLRVERVAEIEATVDDMMETVDAMIKKFIEDFPEVEGKSGVILRTRTKR